MVIYAFDHIMFVFSLFLLYVQRSTRPYKTDRNSCSQSIHILNITTILLDYLCLLAGLVDSVFQSRHRQQCALSNVLRNLICSLSFLCDILYKVEKHFESNEYEHVYSLLYIGTIEPIIRTTLKFKFRRNYNRPNRLF